MQSLMRRLWICRVKQTALVAVLMSGGWARALDWPQWFGPERDGVWRENGLIDKFPADGPRILWRTPLGTGYSGPAVAGERVYVLDRVRAVGPDGKPLSGKQGIQGKEGLLCLKAADGKVNWRHDYDCVYKVSYPSGPRTTPLIHENRVYALGAMGDLFCLEADTGKPVWSKNLVKEYKIDPTPLWGFAAHLLIDGDLLYTLAGGEGSAVVAFNKKTGKEVWKALTTEEICYSPPMIFEAGGKRQLVIWHSSSINGLDPATGKSYWKVLYPADGKPHRPGVNVVTLRREGQLLFLSSTFHGPMMLKFAADKPDVSVLWRKEPKKPMEPEGLSCLIPSPVLKDGHVYGVSFDGALVCLEAESGKELWQTYDLMDGKPRDCGTAFLVPQGDRFVIFTEKGDLILATMTPKEYKEISRAHVIEPAESARGRMVVWSHPAFAHRSVFVRNNKEIIRVDMAAKKGAP
jgi:outer membrane protein assembly factor BamB